MNLINKSCIDPESYTLKWWFKYFRVKISDFDMDLRLKLGSIRKMKNIFGSYNQTFIASLLCNTLRACKLNISIDNGLRQFFDSILCENWRECKYTFFFPCSCFSPSDFINFITFSRTMICSVGNHLIFDTSSFSLHF